jgi:acyl-coenzyme A thioesterase PaaI-like protein
MPESWNTRVTRWGFNWFPAYRGTGARIDYIASDWREVRIRLPLSRRTRNYVGTIFGGSMYAALDPIYMIMLIKILGRDYVVWDKSAAIRFRRPGRSLLTATFRLDEARLDAIRGAVQAEGKTDVRFEIDLRDEAGEVIASCEKVISIRRREAPASR